MLLFAFICFHYALHAFYMLLTCFISKSVTTPRRRPRVTRLPALPAEAGKNHVHQFFPLFNQKKLGTINHNLRSFFSHNHSSEVTLLAIQIFVTYYGIAMQVVSYFFLALSGAKRLLRLFPGCLTLNAYTKTHHFMCQEGVHVPRGTFNYWGSFNYSGALLIIQGHF